MDQKDKYPFYIENPIENNRVEEFLRIFAAILESSNYKTILDIYSRTAMSCSRCASECMLYEASNDPRNIPCYRITLLLKIYKRHFTLRGWLKAKFFGGSFLTEKDIDEITESYYQCTTCGRCTQYCPMGIDHRIIIRLGRYILSEMGIVPKNLEVSVKEQLQGDTKNTSKVPLKALRENLEFLEEEIEEIKGVKVKFPVDVHDAEYVFFAPVSDYLMEADTLMGIACVMHEAGVSWTIASENYDAINYGLFYSDSILGEILENLAAEVKRLNGKKILIGECGHAFRSAKKFLGTYNEGKNIPVVNIIELTSELLKGNKFELDPEIITENVTYHDPCNYARNGEMVKESRQIINSFINNYIEMTPAGSENYCCGGGGGTVTIPQLKEYRMKIAGKRKVEQIEQSGAEIIITPCANCKKQVSELIGYYKLPVRHSGLHDLIFEAIKMNKRD